MQARAAGAGRGGRLLRRGASIRQRRAGRRLPRLGGDASGTEPGEARSQAGDRVAGLGAVRGTDEVREHARITEDATD